MTVRDITGQDEPRVQEALREERLADADRDDLLFDALDAARDPVLELEDWR